MAKATAKKTVTKKRIPKKEEPKRDSFSTIPIQQKIRIIQDSITRVERSIYQATVDKAVADKVGDAILASNAEMQLNKYKLS